MCLLHENVHSDKSKETGSEMFVFLSERLERGQLCHLRFTTLLSFSFPVGFLPLEYENTLSLNKGLPQLQFVSFPSAVFLAVANETWTGNGIIGVINARWQSWHKQKPFVFIHLGVEGSESSLIMLWLELISGPCLSLFTLGAWCITALLESWADPGTFGAGSW